MDTNKSTYPSSLPLQQSQPQPPQPPKCNLCDKEFLNLKSYNAHMIICSFMVKNKREQQQELIEDETRISYKELVKIVYQLCNEVEELKKQINPIPQQITPISSQPNTNNILSSTSSNIIIPTPTQTFSIWFNKLLTEDNEIIDDNDIFELKDKPTHKVITGILSKYYKYNLDMGYINPILIQDLNIFIWDKEDILSSSSSSSSSSPRLPYKWIKLTKDKLQPFIRKLETNILKRISQWSKENINMVYNDEEKSNMCIKIITKLTTPHSYLLKHLTEII